MRLGPKQLKLLMALGSPGTILLTLCARSRSLSKHGLLGPHPTDQSGDTLRITPKGLRVLADALESGQADKILEAVKAERAQRVRL